MLKTVRLALGREAQSSNKDWDQVIPPILQVHKARKGRDGLSMFECLLATTLR